MHKERCLHGHNLRRVMRHLLAPFRARRCKAEVQQSLAPFISFPHRAAAAASDQRGAVPSSQHTRSTSCGSVCRVTDVLSVFTYSLDLFVLRDSTAEHSELSAQPKEQDGAWWRMGMLCSVCDRGPLAESRGPTAPQG